MPYLVDARRASAGLCDKRFTSPTSSRPSPGTDNGFALVMPYANTEAMQQFLDRFAATIAETSTSSWCSIRPAGMTRVR